MKRPNLFVAGAPKSGTTAMHAYLQTHSKVFMAIKEIHYFGNDLDFHPRLNSEEQYLNHFAEASNETYLGDASVSYLYSRTAAKEIRAYSPDAKIIVMLRNPVDLIHSKHAQELFQGTEREKNFVRALKSDLSHSSAKPEDKLPTGPVYRNYCSFTEQLRRFADCFGKDRIHVVIYDDFKEDTHREYLKTLDFLGLVPESLPEFKPVNPRNRVRSYYVRDFLNNPYAPWKQRTRFLPGFVRKPAFKILRSLNVRKEKEALEPALRRTLGEEFRGEVERLSNYLERDFSFWNRQNGL